ncbi:MAG: glycosyltransferase family 2 protein [Candidatus Marinimicrobia bacterium]|nr:glycosyltransferase family 2 protein [Candidatus Neomarinimicrobiota bacterium]
MPIELSIVIPVFDEVESLHQLHQELLEIKQSFDGCEIIYIDDGSSDGSNRVLHELADNDPDVKVLTFFRNYGKAAALSRGFRAAAGQFVATVDSDLQDDPAEIRPMIDMLAEDWDLISGWKKVRHDPLSKRIPSKLYNFSVRLFTGVRIHDSNCGLKVYRSEVVKTLELHGGLHRYIPALAKYKGFRVTEKIVTHRARQHGQTKYGLSRYFHGMLDLMTVLFVGRYFQRPMHFFGIAGLLTSGLGLGVSLYLTINWFRGIWIGSRPLLFLGMLLIIVGIQFFSIGLMAELLVQRRAREEDLIKEVYSSGKSDDEVGP